MSSLPSASLPLFDSAVAMALPDEELQQGGVRPGAPATGRRLRQGELQVPGSHPAQVRQVGGQDWPAHGQEVMPNNYCIILNLI